jgi:hypothetical protein
MNKDNREVIKRFRNIRSSSTAEGNKLTNEIYDIFVAFDIRDNCLNIFIYKKEV